MNVLIAMSGFDEMQKEILLNDFKDNGVVIENMYIARTKMGIFQSYIEHPDISVVLVSEFLEQSNPFKPEDLNDIDELSKDLRVVPILVSENKGTDYVRKLYMAAIYDAIFDCDADLKYVSSIVKEGREKRAARTYYNIEENSIVTKTSSDPESIAQSLKHILDGGEFAQMPSRAEYVMNKLSSGEFRQVIEKLPDSYIEVLKLDGRFHEYFITDDIYPAANISLEENRVQSVDKEHSKEKKKEKKENSEKGSENEAQKEIKRKAKAVPEIKKIPIRVPVPNFHSSAKKEQIKFKMVPQERSLVIVVSAGRKSGSTFLSANMAKALAVRGYIPSLYQFPNTYGKLFDTLSFDTVFNNQFVPHMNKLASEDFIPEGYNEYEGIRFFVPGTEDIEKWNYVRSMKLLFKSDSVSIVDMGSCYKNRWQKDLVKEATKLFAVIDVRNEPEETFLNDIRKIKDEKPGLEILFVLNRCGATEQITYENEYIHALENDFSYVCVPEYAGLGESDVFIKHGEPPIMELIGGFLVERAKENLVSGKSERHTKPEKTEKTVEKIIETKEVVRLNGTMEIGFIGLTHGAGTTYQALLCCYSLSSNYRVAYVELNQSGDMKRYLQMLSKGKDEDCFEYNGVDIYTHLPYAEFVARYRANYDYVVLDFGIWGDLKDKYVFVSTAKKFVVTAGVAWKLEKLREFSTHVSSYPVLGEFAFLVPFISDKKAVQKIRKICEKQDVEFVPAVEQIVCPAESVKDIFCKYLVINPSDKSRNKRRGIFSWKK